jgi:hypothetical protein
VSGVSTKKAHTFVTINIMHGLFFLSSVKISIELVKISIELVKISIGCCILVGKVWFVRVQCFCRLRSTEPYAL